MTDTPISLASTRSLAEAATPGPWFTANFAPDFNHDGVASKSGRGWVEWIVEEVGQSDADAAFIAAANPDVVLALVEAVSAAQAAQEALRRKTLTLKPESYNRNTYADGYGSGIIEALNIVAHAQGPALSRFVSEQPPERREKLGEPAGFAITGGKGFYMRFENGWTVSVQFGPCNYSGHSHTSHIDFYAARDKGERWESGTAEIAAWDANHVWHDFGEDTVAGWKSPAEVLAFMQEIAALPPASATAACLSGRPPKDPA